MPNILLPVLHCKQTQEADCLAACTAMALKFINATLPYKKLLDMLHTTPYGAIASRITALNSMGFSVIYEQGTLTDLHLTLDKRLPVITLVQTGELPYWTYNTMHAILLVGYDEHYFFANDPYFDKAPIEIPVADFDLAWFEMGNKYAVISTG